jgi:hypothetical protein
VVLNSIDRLLFVGLYRPAPGVLDALKIVSAGDVDELAPRRLPSLLALEIPTARWPAEDSGGHPPPHPRDEHPILGGLHHRYVRI